MSIKNKLSELEFNFFLQNLGKICFIELKNLLIYYFKKLGNSLSLKYIVIN